MNKIPIKVNCDLFYTDEKGKPACEGLNKAYCIYSAGPSSCAFFKTPEKAAADSLKAKIRISKL